MFFKSFLKKSLPLENNEIPIFKYHLNQLKTRVVIKEDIKCEVCNKMRNYKYVGPFYAIEEVEEICPWCIASGEAANKYGGEFVHINSCEVLNNKEYLDELLHRTPSYNGWQQERWVNHCDDYCSFINYVGWEEIKHLTEELKDDLILIKHELGLSQRELEEALVNNGKLQGYLFKCLHCGKYKLITDSD